MENTRGICGECEEKETFDVMINVSEAMYYVKAGPLWNSWII